METYQIRGLDSPPVTDDGSHATYWAAHDLTGQRLTFHDAVDMLRDEYGAALASLYYEDPETGDMVEMVDHKANINPAWTGDGRDDAPDGDASWVPVSNRYAPLAADRAYGPLVDVLAERVAGGAPVFGHLELSRAGGEAHFDLYVPALAFEIDGERFVPGIQTGYSHYGDRRVYAEPVVLRAPTGAVIRGLGERHRRRHVSPDDDETGESARDDVAEWWVDVTAVMEHLDDTLASAVADAKDYQVDFGTLPYGPEGFYDHLGVPGGIAHAAATRLPAGDRTTAWELASALFGALGADYGGKLDGDAMRSHIQVANTILFRPPRADQQAVRDWLNQSDDGQQVLQPSETRRAMRQRFERIDDEYDGVGKYMSMKQRLQQQIAEAEEAADAEADEAEGSA